MLYGRWPAALGSWFLVHGPGQDGPATPGQVLCSGMESVLSLEDATKSLVRSQVVLSDGVDGSTFLFWL